jgi:hypothetical protein
MTPGDILLAFCLINTDCLPKSEYNTPNVRHAIQIVGIAQEIIDGKETRYILDDPADFENEVNLVRDRAKRLANTPSISLAQGFPDRNWINEQMAFNRKHHQWLESQLQFQIDRQDYFREWIKENNRLYAVWDKIRDVKCEFYYVTVRRDAMRDLREMLGEEDFWGRHWPPTVPIWRFADIR